MINGHTYRALLKPEKDLAKNFSHGFLLPINHDGKQSVPKYQKIL